MTLKEENDELNARVNMALDELCRTHDGLGVVVFLMNPDNQNWSVGVSKEMLNAKNFCQISFASADILANMITPKRSGL